MIHIRINLKIVSVNLGPGRCPDCPRKCLRI